jgi:hypothetical protein
MGCPDPRLAEPWVYDRFKREAPKHLEVFNGTKAKFYMTHEMFLSLYMDLDLGNLDHLQDAVTYSVLFFTALRRGHIIPKSKTADSCKHLLRWEHVKFLPDFENCTEVVYLLESGKVRHVAKKDPTFTATGRCNIAKICPVQLLNTLRCIAEVPVFVNYLSFFPTHHPLGTRQHGNIKPSVVGYRARVLRIHG